MPVAPTWTRLAAYLNGEGSQITIELKLTTPVAGGAFDASDAVDILGSNTYADGQKGSIGSISGWRMTASTAALSSSLTGNLDGAGISDVAGPVQVGSNYELTFKYRLAIRDAGLFAINNGASGVVISSLPAAFVQVQFQGGSPGPFSSPGYTSVAVDATAVGRLPPVGATETLKLWVDVHAEKVSGTGAGALVTWHDLSVAGENLTGKPSSPANQPTLNWTNGTFPYVDFDSTVPQFFQSDTTPPVFTSPVTLAAVFIPDSNGAVAHLFGRYSSLAGAAAWRLYFNGATSPGKVYYQSAYTGGAESAELPLAAGDTTVFVLFRRQADESWEGWINGRPVADGAFAHGVNTGSSYLTIGASTGISPAPFDGRINQAAAYSADLNDLQLSLVMHQVAMRAALDLGTPIPASWQVQPYGMSGGGVATPAPKRLDRRPIAVVKLSAGLWNENPMGQREPEWRNYHSITDIVNNLEPGIVSAWYDCDQFEIMFSKPGGGYSQDLVMTYIFGQTVVDGALEDVVLQNSWDALEAVFDDLNLAADNDRFNRNTAGHTQRRAWFYTGGGLPVDDSGVLDTTGLMRQRQVAPATPAIYRTTILAEWTGKDDRYRCFFLDAASHFFGKLVELVHDDVLNSNYVLVGEAIPAYDPDEAQMSNGHDARLGAPWFSLVEFGKAPWWNVDRDPNGTGLPRKTKGYNPLWKSDWRTMPIYFGVSGGDSPNLFNTTGNPGDGSNMSEGYIFKWVVKGAVPVAMTHDVRAKVGRAWNYGTGRVIPSRLIRCPRLIRSIRC